VRTWSFRQMALNFSFRRFIHFRSSCGGMRHKGSKNVIEVATKDCTALSDAELAEMADMCAEGPSGFEAGFSPSTARSGFLSPKHMKMDACAALRSLRSNGLAGLRVFSLVSRPLSERPPLSRHSRPSCAISTGEPFSHFPMRTSLSERALPIRRPIGHTPVLTMSCLC